LGYDAVQIDEKSTDLSKEHVASTIKVEASDQQDRSWTFFRNFGELIPDYTALHPRRYHSSLISFVYS
jgi:hypothetical protein